MDERCARPLASISGVDCFVKNEHLVHHKKISTVLEHRLVPMNNNCKP